MTGEKTEMPRPLRRLPDLPDPSDIRTLRAQAKKLLGMSDRAAGALSTMWVHPEEVLPQIANPRRMRIPGGDLLYIEGRAWTPRLLADFANPRNAADYSYALAGAGGDVFKAEVAADAAELQITVSGRDALLDALEIAMDKTRGKNEPFPPIREQGIMDAPFGVMAVLKFGDGDTDIAVPLVKEGSSRISWAHHILGVMPEETLVQMPSSSRPIKEFVDGINEIVSKPMEDITGDERARVRCATVNFILIVGFEADAGNAPNLAEAIKVKVAQEHLNVKVDWTAAAQNSVMADDCLAATWAANLLDSRDEYNWLLGHLDRQAASDAGVAQYPDDRFARLLWLFTTKKKAVHDAIRRPIAFVLRKETGRKSQVRKTTKLPLGIELVAREFRGTNRYLPSVIERIIKVMTSGADITNIASNPEWQPTRQPLKSLLNGARKEQQHGNPGPASIELAVRALYYAAIYDVLRIPRNDLGAGKDRRPIAELLEDMLGSPAGIEQLGHIIEDGRAERAPRLRDENGKATASGDGEPVVLDNDLLRDKLFPKNGKDEPSGIGGKDPFLLAQRDVAKALTALQTTMQALEQIEDASQTRIVEIQGLEPQQAMRWRKILETERSKIDEWFEIGVSYAAGTGKAPQSVADLEEEADVADEED
ncbi:hypothetical protein [Dactylosporangium sp. CS-033363]|uniref:hypothetical protein n=1 Tax=Dactylosporangium sp. CS-033363 TaxID=3239935 RepID=UPI003D92737F